jgi:hypothetical protein
MEYIPALECLLPQARMGVYGYVLSCPVLNGLSTREFWLLGH